MIRSILLLQASQLLGRAFFLVFSLWYLNRYLGVEAKGVWAGMYYLFGIFSVFANMGFELWLTRAVAANRLTSGSALGFLFRTKSGLWLASLVIGAVYVGWGGHPAGVAVPFGVALVVDGIAVAEQAVFEGKSNARAMAIMSFIKSGGFAILAVVPVWIFGHPPLAVFAWVFVLALVIRTLYGWRAWKLLPKAGPPLPAGARREFLLMGAYTLVTVLYFKIDGVMLLQMAGPKVTGDYSNAYELIEGCLFISAAVGAVLYPRLVQADVDTRARLFDRMMELILVVATCGICGIWFLGQWFGTLIAGPEFAGAVGPLLVLAWGLPLMFGNGILSRWLFAHGRERFAMTTAAAAALLNALGNWILIPSLGAMGAAIMTVVTEGMLFILWIVWGRMAVGALGVWLGLSCLMGLVAAIQSRWGRWDLALTIAIPVLGVALFTTVQRVRRLNR